MPTATVTVKKDPKTGDYSLTCFPPSLPIPKATSNALITFNLVEQNTSGWIFPGTLNVNAGEFYGITIQGGPDGQFFEPILVTNQQVQFTDVNSDAKTYTYTVEIINPGLNNKTLGVDPSIVNQSDNK